MVLKLGGLWPILQKRLQVFKAHNNYCKVVHWALNCRLFNDSICHCSTHLMHCLRVLTSLFSLSWFDRVDRVPASVEHLLIAQSVENSVTAKHNEIMEIVSNWKLRYFRLSNNDTFFTSILGVLGLDVTKSARHRKPSWNHSMRPQNEVLLWLVFSW